MGSKGAGIDCVGSFKCIVQTIALDIVPRPMRDMGREQDRLSFSSLHLGDLGVVFFCIIPIDMPVPRARGSVDRSFALLEAAGWHFRGIWEHLGLVTHEMMGWKGIWNIGAD